MAANTPLVFVVSNGQIDDQQAGVDALFSWHAARPDGDGKCGETVCAHTQVTWRASAGAGRRSRTV